MNTLAELSLNGADAAGLGAWLVYGAAAGVLVLVVVQLIDRFTGRSFEAHKTNVDSRFQAAAKSRKDIHEKTETLGRELSAQRTTTEHISKEINQLREQLTAADDRHDKALEKIHDRIDNLPARIAETFNAARRA